MWGLYRTGSQKGSCGPAPQRNVAALKTNPARITATGPCSRWRDKACLSWLIGQGRSQVPIEPVVHSSVLPVGAYLNFISFSSYCKILPLPGGTPIQLEPLEILFLSKPYEKVITVSPAASRKLQQDCIAASRLHVDGAGAIKS